MVGTRPGNGDCTGKRSPPAGAGEPGLELVPGWGGGGAPLGQWEA